VILLGALPASRLDLRVYGIGRLQAMREPTRLQVFVETRPPDGTAGPRRGGGGRGRKAPKSLPVLTFKDGEGAGNRSPTGAAAPCC